MKEFKKEHLKEAISKQMEIAWHSVKFEDLNGSWYSDYTITKEQEKEYIEWLKSFLKPFVSKHRLEKEISWFILSYWLKTK
jgi:hypothetical protein